MRIDGFRDSGKKIVKVSISVPGLDFNISADYNNFLVQLVQLDESVSSMEISLKDLKEQVILIFFLTFQLNRLTYASL